jgi:hypothetical protein
MALAASSYGSVAEVEALVKHLLDGASGFDATTNPTQTEVETIIDRVSGVLNTALSASGFSIPLTSTAAVLACDDWVVRWTFLQLRYIYPHLGITEQEAQPAGDIYTSAMAFVDMNEQAFKNMGETVSDATSDGLAFTALTEHDERADPDNDSYEQPKFRRGQFDN